MPTAKKSAETAAETAKSYAPTVKQSGAFIKHVLPAAVKPIHSLWHEILGFTFLVFCAIAIFKVVRHPGALNPGQLAIISVFIIVTGAYGISSVLKARRISRS
jgi:hypothetical protein